MPAQESLLARVALCDECAVGLKRCFYEVRSQQGRQKGSGSWKGVCRVFKNLHSV